MDIVNDVIAENFPELIMDFYPKAFWNTFPQEILNACPDDLMKSDLFRFNFKQKLESEFFTKDGKRFIPDCPFDTFEDLVIGLEFQSSRLDYKRKTVFYEYQANLHFKHKKDVRMVVFSTVHTKHKLFRHRVGPCEEFTMLIISLKALNQKQTLNNSLYKIRNKFRLSDKEKALFLASPMMDSKNKAEAINVLLNNFYGIKDISHEEYEDMIKIVLIYANKWCYKEVENSYGGSDMVVLTPGAQKLYERLVNEGIEQGIEQGIDIIAVNMIKEGFSLEDTSRATGLPKAKIAQLCKSK
ncbi:MAG: hypothetical protein Q4Q24_08265 [Methanobrevibacter ruminantium]|uniref:hypothetical protein n=1 Tax=Methanobrevibacter ruminantium TaxID=83816 RepID=UPI0026ECFEE2|nr:hypothetical protein [Methanobrevibacter ruminantium]MDO5843245.1 hypothetical protein [Methanobrevibacter ruminantium]